ncbi:MAG: DNA polymerase III subunit beta [Clostridiales bacterium]|nr:DNA polymerase III subunit beta [Clostridiales bacterium]
MIFTCEKQKLQEGILITQKAITGKTTMKILEGILINATESGITLIGSDMDISIKTKVEADVKEIGKVVIDSKIFGEIIRKLPDSLITIEVIENDTVQISCEKSVFNVVYMNGDEYPTLPEINNNDYIEIPQNVLKNMIKSTTFAIAQDETRPILQGVLFEIKDKNLNLVALDGYRLAIKSEYLETDMNIQIVIPGRNLNEVSRILEESDDEVKITFTNNHILFNLGETQIISRLLEGSYVNYNSLLPQEHKITIEVEKQKLQSSIERASLMAKEGNSYLIKLDVQEDYLIITSNSQLGKVKEELSITLQGESIEIAFNSKYLLDVLKNMDGDNVILEMTSSVTPCVITEKNSESSKYLVLPVRLMR